MSREIIYPTPITMILTRSEPNMAIQVPFKNAVWGIKKSSLVNRENCTILRCLHVDDSLWQYPFFLDGYEILINRSTDGVISKLSLRIPFS